jgi:hypothetical protein
VGPRASLDSVEKRKSLSPAENQTPAVQPAAIPTALYSHILVTRRVENVPEITSSDLQEVGWNSVMRRQSLVSRVAFFQSI